MQHVNVAFLAGVVVDLGFGVLPSMVSFFFIYLKGIFPTRAAVELHATSRASGLRPLV